LQGFRFNEAFEITRDVKAFLNTEGGITCGALVDTEQHEVHAENQNAQRRPNRRRGKEAKGRSSIT
jgi:hypothetical protein